MANGIVLDVTDQSFKSEVLESNIPVIVDFWAPWCGPCKAIAPILAQVAEEFGGKVKVAKVNVDENIEVAQQFRVTAIPTILFVKGGEVVEQVVGSRPKAFFQELLQRHA